MTRNDMNKTLEKHAIELSNRMVKANLTTREYAECLDILCHVFVSMRPDPPEVPRTSIFATPNTSRKADQHSSSP